MPAKTDHGQDKLSIQNENFDMADEYQRLLKVDPQCGAVVTFVGLVRDFSAGSAVKSLFIEHYPAMTESSLRSILSEARQKWSLGALTLIHRVGYLASSEQIVMVGVSSQHRHAAFSAAEFIMDHLKTRAPFWKKELTSSGDFWVEAKITDQQAAAKWSE